MPKSAVEGRSRPKKPLRLGARVSKRTAKTGPEIARSAEDYQAATNRTPRRINRDLIFHHIRTRQPISRADLARVSGLQRSTVSTIVEELLKEQWVLEAELADSPRGRKPTNLILNGRKAVVAVDIHPERSTFGIADLSGNLSFERQLALPCDPAKVIDAIVDGIRQTMAEHEGYTFEGIGIAMPGRFSRELAKAVFAPNIAWPIEQIKSRIESAICMPVAVDNVANACVLSEVWFGNTDATRELVVVNVSEGIGTGIYVNGRVLRGQGEGAGEFGHIQVDPEGLRCGCGSRGCWETTASNRAAIGYFRQLSPDPVQSFNDLVDYARAEHPSALAAIERMCRTLGRGIHMIVLALAPTDIIIVGEIAGLWNLAGPIVECELRKFPMISMPALRVPVEPERARLRGAVALIMDERPWLAF